MSTILHKIAVVTLAVGVCALVGGCDPITRHKALTTLFDGVPSLPPPQQLCEEYTDKRVAELRDELTGRKTAKAGNEASTESQHAPYVEKRCNDCHDKNAKDGLVAPKNELCYVCHVDFVQGAFVHGPVAVADCLACHVPHTSSSQSLLKTDRSAICGTCHTEKRVAAAMHDKVMANGMACIDCHDPHFGAVPFFLK